MTTTPTASPTETETPTSTPDERAAISFVLLCTNDEGVTSVGGRESDECPDGEPFVRWEGNGNEFEAEEDSRGTTITATEFKEAGEPVAAEWNSSIYNVTSAVVFGGRNTCTYTYSPDGTLPQNGTVETCEGSAGGGNGGGSASLEMAGTLAAVVSVVADRIGSQLPSQAGGGTVVPLALLLSGTAVAWRREN